MTSVIVGMFRLLISLIEKGLRGQQKLSVFTYKGYACVQCCRSIFERFRLCSWNILVQGHQGSLDAIE